MATTPPTVIPIRITSNLNQLNREAKDFEKSLDAAVARVISFTATTRILYGIGNAFKAITTSAIEVESAMAKIASILGTTSTETKKLQAQLFELANSTSSSFQDAADAAEEFSRQGLSLSKTLSATNAALQLNKLSGGDIKKTIEGLTAVMSTAGDEMLEFTDIAAKLSAVDKNFATSGTGLLEGLKRFGGVAKENGLIVDEQIGLLASLKQVTGRSEAVLGNSLKSILTSFGTERVQKDLEGIGVSVKDVNGEFRNAIDIGRDLSTVFQGLNDQQKEFIKQRVAGKYQANAFQGLIDSFKPRDGGESFLDKAVRTSQNSTDDASKRIEQLNQTTEASIQRFKNNLTQVGAELGDRISKPVLEQLLKIGNGLGGLLFPNLGKKSEEAGKNIGSMLAAGIGNVLSGPGLLTAGFIITRFLVKIIRDSSAAVQSLLGIEKIKRNITAVDQTIVNQINPRLQENDLKRIALLTTQYEKEQAILSILNRQLAVREAMGFASAFLQTVPGINPNLPGARFRRAATGDVPHAVFQEAIDIKNGVGGARRSAKPEIKVLNLGNGPEKVVVNTDEKIVKNYMGSGRDAVLTRDMMGYASGAVPARPKKPLPIPSVTTNAQRLANAIRAREAAIAAQRAADAEARKNQRNSRATRLATAGFATSFIGGAVAEGLRGPNGESTRGQRLTENVSNNIGMATLIGSLNPVAGTLAGIGLAVQSFGKVVTEANVPLDEAKKNQEEAIKVTQKQSDSINGYIESFNKLNDAIESGNEKAIVAASDAKARALEAVKSEGLRQELQNATTNVELSDILQKSNAVATNYATQAGINASFRKYQSEGSFNSRKSTSAFNFISRELSDEFISSVLDNASREDLLKFSKSDKLEYSDISKLVRDPKLGGLLSDISVKGASLSDSTLSGDIIKASRTRLESQSVSKRGTLNAIDSAKLFELIQAKSNSLQTDRALNIAKFANSLDNLSKEVDLASDKLSQLGKAESDYILSIGQTSLEIANKVEDIKQEFISTAGESILKNTSLNSSNIEKALAAITKFSESGDLDEFTKGIKLVVGAGSTKPLIDLASKSLEEQRKIVANGELSNKSAEKNFSARKQNISDSLKVGLYGGANNFSDTLSASKEGLRLSLSRNLQDIPKNKIPGFLETVGGLIPINQNAIAKKNLNITRANGANALTILSGLQAEQSAGLFDLPEGVGTGFLDFKRNQASTAFANKRKSDIIEEVGALSPVFVESLNRQFKEITKSNIPLFSKDNQNKIQRFAANGDFAGAFGIVNEITKSGRTSGKEFENLNKDLKGFSDFISSRNDISSFTEEAARKFAETIVKGSIDKQLLEEAKKQTSSLESIQANISGLAQVTSGNVLYGKNAILSGNIGEMQKKVKELEERKITIIRQENSSLGSNTSTYRNKREQVESEITKLKKDIETKQKELFSNNVTEFTNKISDFTKVIDGLKEPLNKVGAGITNTAKDFINAVDVNLNISNSVNGDDFTKTVSTFIVSTMYNMISEAIGFSPKIKPVANSVKSKQTSSIVK